jgi:hypothetical protein
MTGQSSLTETSVVVAVWQLVIAGLSLTDDSTIGMRLQQISTTLARAIQSSGLATFGAVLSHWSRASFIYRWLTAEPDPKTVVINLRRTYTVGPILAVFDRIVTPLIGILATAGTQSLARSIYDALCDHPIRMVSFVAFAALLTELALSAAFGTLTLRDVTVRLGVIALAGLGTQIRVSWDQCTESVAFRFLIAVIEPPEPPDTNESKEGSNHN